MIGWAWAARVAAAGCDSDEGGGWIESWGDGAIDVPTDARLVVVSQGVPELTLTDLETSEVVGTEPEPLMDSGGGSRIAYRPVRLLTPRTRWRVSGVTDPYGDELTFTTGDGPSLLRPPPQLLDLELGEWEPRGGFCDLSAQARDVTASLDVPRDLEPGTYLALRSETSPGVFADAAPARGGLVTRKFVQRDADPDTVPDCLTPVLVLPSAQAIAPPAWTVTGDRADHLGGSIAGGGDLNGDGWPDVVVGAHTLSDPEAEEGALLVYAGGPAGPAAVPTATVEVDVSWSHVGAAVAFAGDVNGDGYDDVVDTGSGAKVWLGSASGLVPAPAWSLPGVELGAPAGDIDGDGFDDLLIGDPDGPNNTDYGSVRLFRGSPAGLAASPDWFVTGNERGEQLGWALAVGDFDGDGWRDAAASAPGEYNHGIVRVFRGSSTGLAVVPDPDIVGPDWSVLGRMLVVADVDADGFDDLIAGAPGLGGGAIVTFFGSPTGLVASPARVSPCSRTSLRCVQFGEVLASIGDLNGDGFGDVAVGASDVEPGGAVVVYLGSSIGLSIAPLLVVEGQPDDLLGIAVAGAGDVNRDGLDDLLFTQWTWVVDGQERASLHFGQALPDSDLDQIVDLQDICPTAPDLLQADSDLDGVGDACDAPHLAVVGTVSAGGVARLEATGVIPGETVAFAGAVGSGGAGPCLPALGGLCLGLGPAPWVLGSAIADAAGVAFVDVNVPLALVPNGTYAVQAAIRRGAGGSASTASPVVVLDGTVLDWDADGLTDAAETSLGADPTLADTDGDGRLDGDDVPPAWSPLDPDGDGDGVLDGADLCRVGDDLADADADGAPDACDGCPSTADPAQTDGDGDGVGSACEGPALDLDVQLHPTSGGPWPSFGHAVAILDVDGDGFDELVVGAPHAEQPLTSEGLAELFPGSAGGVAGAPTWSVAGGAANIALGWMVAAAGDTNGDGFGDLALGGYDGVRVWLGSAGGLAVAPAWTVATDPSSAGRDLAALGAGDLDGDGFDDLLVTDWRVASERGAAQLFRGTPTGPESVASWELVGGAPYDALGIAASGLGDVDGDGLADLAIATNWFGEVSVFLGSPTGLGATGDLVLGVEDHPLLAGGDTDGDGYDELVVAIESERRVRSYAGSAWGLRTSPQTFVAQLRPRKIAMLDADGDGSDDLALGGIDQVGFDTYFDGYVDVWLGGETGLATEPGWIGWLPYLSGGGFGDALAGGDLNGDGLDDLAVGADVFDGFQGTVAVYSGRAR